MAVKSWNVGDVLSAADMNVWTVPIVAIKPGDTGRNTTTTMTADPDLQITVAAGATYDVTVIARYKGGTNGSSDAQFTITVPSGTTGFFNATRVQVTSFPTTTILDQPFGTAVNAGTNGTSQIQPLLMKACVVVGGTAGTVAVAWAQNTSNGTNTSVLQNSFISAQRIG